MTYRVTHKRDVLVDGHAVRTIAEDLVLMVIDNDIARTILGSQEAVQPRRVLKAIVHHGGCVADISQAPIRVVIESFDHLAIEL